MSTSVRPPVLTKSDFYRRFFAGEFGNRGEMWNTVEEYKASGFKGMVGVRYRVADKRGVIYDIKATRFDYVLKQLRKRGVLPRDIIINAVMPTDKVVIQGEVYHSHRGLDLRYSCMKAHMRTALKEAGCHAHGLFAVNLLKLHMPGRDYDELMQLLELYPDHIVEFTTLSCYWGVIPGMRTMFWEVRRY